MISEQILVFFMLCVLTKGEITRDTYNVNDRSYDDSIQYSPSPVRRPQYTDSVPTESVSIFPRFEDPKIQRFMDALIMEAGLHYLYPPKDQMQEDTRLVEDEEQDEIKYPIYGRMNGQPEYIDLIRKRKSEQEPMCPDQCFNYRPVCGSDGKAYDSECHFMKANCRLQNVSIIDWEACRGKHFLCPSMCLDINDPVCGEDGRIYHNICVMRKRNCGKLLETRPVKFCYPKGREGKMIDACPDDCQEIYKPVCGSDGVIYYNACFMKMKTCGSDIELLDLEACTRKKSCPERCVPIHDPVCGSDGKIYLNLCKMLLENCGTNVKKMPESFCGGIRRG